MEGNLDIYLNHVHVQVISNDGKLLGGTNYNKLLKMLANITCLAKVISRSKAKIKHSCNALYELIMEFKKDPLYQRISPPCPCRMSP